MGYASKTTPMLQIIGLLLVASVGCGPAVSTRDAGGESTTMSQQLAADLKVIGQRRILFVHHSVGVNILAGVERLDAEAGGGHLLMAWLPRASAIEGPVLAHGGGGRNKDPKSKIDFFAATIRNEPRLKPDVAFMKLCFVDFEPGTDVEDLFSHYQRTLESLKREHPEIRFAHVTAPLFKRPSDLKSSLNRLLGREVWEDAANVKRAEYNRRLIESFPSDPVFDLARVEATGPDGSVTAFEQAGRKVPSLNPIYTDDGGHLNDLGQRAAGAAMIRFLAGAVESRPKTP